MQLYGLQLSPFIGNVSVDSLSLMPDYERWEQLHSQNQDVQPMLLDVQSKSIDVVGVNYLAVLFGKDVDVDEVSIVQPELQMTVMREDTTSQQKPLHQSVPDKLKGLKIGHIRLDRGKISYRDGTKDNIKEVASIGQYHLTIDDVKLDSQSFQAQDRAYYANSILFEAAQGRFLTPDGLYRLTSDSLRLNTQGRMLEAKQVVLDPTTDAAGMARAKGESVSYMEIEVPVISFNGVDYPAHSRKGHFIARQLLIHDPSFYIFKDKKNFSNKTKTPLLHEMVQNMPTKFLLDSLKLKSGFIEYEEIVPEAAVRGRMTLENLNISMSNFSNMPEHISMENPAVAHVRGVVMGKVPANMTVRMPLLAENGYHTVHGEVASANPEILNPIIEPTAFMRIESGHISRGSVDLEFTNEQATGTMHLIYSNFEVELLSKGTGGEQSLGKEILSELANWIVIKESNPGDAGEEPRVGEVEVQRNEKKSMFSYWARGLIDGFKSIATIK
ncbi:hypothetical protein GCM10027443_02990 [Pontibacter brevis]